MSKAPEMQFVLKLELNAKTKADLITALKGIIFDLDRDERADMPCIISAGSHSRYNLSLKHNKDQTDENHKKELDEYLKGIS